MGSDHLGVGGGGGGGGGGRKNLAEIVDYLSAVGAAIFPCPFYVCVCVCVLVCVCVCVLRLIRAG